MTRDEQARARLVEIALQDEFMWRSLKDDVIASHVRRVIRKSAGFKDSLSGSWCAAGLTDAMERAGLLVPAPGTPARRGAIALLDWAHERGEVVLSCKPDSYGLWHTQQHQQVMPGDIIAWLQHPPADPAGWRRGHVAVIVKVDDESVTTVGWNEGPIPGRVMMRRLWRDAGSRCDVCSTVDPVVDQQTNRKYEKLCLSCKGAEAVPRSATVLWRRPGGLYGIARPVAA